MSYTFNIVLIILMNLFSSREQQGKKQRQVQKCQCLSTMFNQFTSIPLRFQKVSIRCWIFCSIKICCPKVGKIIELCLSFVTTWLIIPSISERNKSFEISSFVETQATSLLKEYPVEFVKYPCVCTLVHQYNMGSL